MAYPKWLNSLNAKLVTGDNEPKETQVREPVGVDLGGLTKTQRQKRASKSVKSNYTLERKVWATSTTG